MIPGIEQIRARLDNPPDVDDKVDCLIWNGQNARDLTALLAAMDELTQRVTWMTTDSEGNVIDFAADLDVAVRALNAAELDNVLKQRAIDELTAENAELKQKADVWTAQAAIWRTSNVKLVDKLIQSTSSYEDRIDELTADLSAAVDAHIKITAAMRCGGRTPEKALDTMLRIRQNLGRDK